MNEQNPTPPRKSRSGCFLPSCLLTTGILMTAVAVVMALVGILTMAKSEGAHEDRLRANDDLLEAYYADTVRIIAQQAEYRRIQTEALEKGDTMLYQAMEDSLAVDHFPRLYVGFPIGGAFGLAIIFLAVIPLIIGIVLIAIYIRRKKKARCS